MSASTVVTNDIPKRNHTSTNIEENKCNINNSKVGSTTLNESALRMKLLASLQNSEFIPNNKNSDKEIPDSY